MTFFTVWPFEPVTLVRLQLRQQLAVVVAAAKGQMCPITHSIYSQRFKYTRPRKIFRRFSALWFWKNLDQFLSALGISGHSERFSPGTIRFEVGGPVYINSPPWPPTSECILPGENLSEWPEIARALRNWPKFFKNHRAENPRKISRGLPFKGPWLLALSVASGTAEIQENRQVYRTALGTEVPGLGNTHLMQTLNVRL